MLCLVKKPQTIATIAGNAGLLSISKMVLRKEAIGDHRKKMNPGEYIDALSNPASQLARFGVIICNQCHELTQDAEAGFEGRPLPAKHECDKKEKEDGPFKKVKREIGKKMAKLWKKEGGKNKRQKL